MYPFIINKHTTMFEQGSQTLPTQTCRLDRISLSTVHAVRACANEVVSVPSLWYSVSVAQFDLAMEETNRDPPPKKKLKRHF